MSRGVTWYISQPVMSDDVSLRDTISIYDSVLSRDMRLGLMC